MYTLNADVFYTRRNRMHFVLDDTGTLAWSGQTIVAALEFLEAEGQVQFYIEGLDDEPRFLVEAKQT